MVPQCVLVAFVVFPQAALAGEYYWPQQKGDVNRTGYSPYTVTTNLEVEPTWVWKDPDLDVIRCTPLIDDKKNIYLGTQAGKMYKFSPDGAMLWSYRSRRGNTPTVSSLMDGSIYLNTKFGFVVALDMETGKERWATQVAGATAGDTACVFALNKTIISATSQPGSTGTNNRIVALNEDGTHRWTFDHTWPSFNFQASSPGDGTMVFQDRAGGVYRLSLDDGGLLWESGIRDRLPWFFTTGATICGPNGLVYAASNYHNNEGIIHAYRLEDGVQVWRKNVFMPSNQAVAYGMIAGYDKPAVVAGIGENPGFPVILSLGFLPKRLQPIVNKLSVWMAGRPTWLWGTREAPAALVALDAETGATRWSWTPPPFARPACEGEEAWAYERFEIAQQHPEYEVDTICLPDNWAQAVIGGDGTVYAGYQDGKLYAVRDANGNGHLDEGEVSGHYFGHAFQGSQAIAPGMLAVAPCGGGLYVFKN